MPSDSIKIRGARVHNLKNVDLEIPRNKLVVFTGVSGSGKTSLAFDTLYAEAERRFVESLSSYARQFLGMMEKPDVDSIDGLSPAISIDQKSVSKNPRSTVGTITEIYDYLRILYARIGVPHCPKCGDPVVRQSPSEIVDRLLNFPEGTSIQLLAPVVRDKKGEHQDVFREVERLGLVRVRVNGRMMRTTEARTLKLEKYKRHSIEAIVDRISVGPSADRSRVADSVEQALRFGSGLLIAQIEEPEKGATKKSGSKKGGTTEVTSRTFKPGRDVLYSEHFACPRCKINLPEIEPRTFSFNSPHGACPECQGLGSRLIVDPELVIPNKNLTLAEGALKPWAAASHRVGRQSWYSWMLRELSTKYKFSLSVPVRELPKEVVDLILYGDKSGDALELKWGDWKGETAFEGVVGNLMRRWQETESEYTKEEIERYMVNSPCEACKGKRLRPEALAVKIKDHNVGDLVDMSIKELKAKLPLIKGQLSAVERQVAEPIIKEVDKRLGFLLDVGLDYLTLEREAGTLSGGESQRIRLASQIGSQLTGVLYILDEPSIGLHQRDQERLIETLKHLRDIGNTVIVVEHDPQTIREADWVVDVGPAAGKHGGKIMFCGTVKQLLRSKTLTGAYISGKKEIKVPAQSRIRNPKFLRIVGAEEHNLKKVDVNIPIGMFVCVTGVSGSGKSTLVNDILANALSEKFYNAKVRVGKHKDLIGTEEIDKVVRVDQSPIGRTPRSNPATYINAFGHIRDLFAAMPEAKVRGYKTGRFSFNVKGGRCEACEGQGSKKIEMYFLPDVYVECEVCAGTRYNKEALEITYRDKNIAEVLKMPAEEALKFFTQIPSLKQKLQTLVKVGLGYIELGQPAPSLSGGEAQRVKLANELSRRATGKTLYILDEPTTGLHPDDIVKLLGVLRALVERGNTVLIIEHNLDVIANADFIIDLGPEGGAAGGEVIAQGAPDVIMKTKGSYTGEYLRKFR